MNDTNNNENNRAPTVRELYRTLTHVQTHLVQSTEIATACLCPNLFTLSNLFGVIRGERDYDIANTIHDIMGLALPSTILSNWRYGTREYENISRTIQRDSASIIEQAISDKKEWIRREGREIPENFDDSVNDRFHALLIGFAKRIMRKYDQPKRAVTEVTITNTKNFHEGRLDAILEYSYGYGVIDWKAYDIDPVTSNGHEKWQLISNLLLANYRYTGNEDDWGKCIFGSVIYYTGAYMPRMPLSVDTISKVKNSRLFDHDILCGKSPRAQKPRFCPVCDTGAEACSDCRFYREDYKLASEGRFPTNYEQIRKFLVSKRYETLEERAGTHRHKFVIDIMIDKIGEEAALQQLEKAGIIHRGYRLSSNSSDNNTTTILLTRDYDSLLFRTFIEPRQIIRIISKEDGIPLLACISERGVVNEVNRGQNHIELVVDVYHKASVKRSKQQLNNNLLPIIIIPDEINLTRRILQPMNTFHRLAANILLPAGYFDNGSSF
jgi:hypothetical protein